MIKQIIIVILIIIIYIKSKTASASLHGLANNASDGIAEDSR
jgi:hypothetical protein